MKSEQLVGLHLVGTGSVRSTGNGADLTGMSWPLARRDSFWSGTSGEDVEWQRSDEGREVSELLVEQARTDGFDLVGQAH